MKKNKDPNQVEMKLINMEIKQRIDELIKRAERNRFKKQKTWLDILFNL